MARSMVLDATSLAPARSTLPVVVPCPRCTELVLLELTVRPEGPWAELVSQKCSCRLTDDEWADVGSTAKSILEGGAPAAPASAPALTPDAEPQGVVAHRVIRSLVVAASGSALATPEEKDAARALLREALSAAVAYLRMYDPAFQPEPTPEEPMPVAALVRSERQPQPELALA